MSYHSTGMREIFQREVEKSVKLGVPRDRAEMVVACLMWEPEPGAEIAHEVDIPFCVVQDTNDLVLGPPRTRLVK